VLSHVSFEANASKTGDGNVLATADKSGGQSFAAEDAALVSDKGKATSPSLQQTIRQAEKELWPNGAKPARIKDRDAAIAAWFSKKNQTAPSERTIRRALK
jgi:hypothetical protein